MQKITYKSAVKKIYDTIYDDGRIIYNSNKDTIRADKIFYVRVVMWVAMLTFLLYLGYLYIGETQFK